MARVRHLACVAALAAVTASVSAGPVFNLNFEFSGGVAPAGAGPWMTLAFTQSGSDVLLTITNNLGGAEHVKLVFFNVKPANVSAPSSITAPTVTYVAGLSDATTTPTGPVLRKASNPFSDATFKADGDGYFDYRIDFQTSAGVNRFTGTEKAVFRIASATASWFDDTSETGGGTGTYHAAAHVLSTPSGGGGSGWIGDNPVIPLPTAAGMGFTALLGLGCVRCRRDL